MHQVLSWIKSVIRIVGYAFLWKVSVVASIVLIVSEIVGVVEEIGHGSPINGN